MDLYGGAYAQMGKVAVNEDTVGSVEWRSDLNMLYFPSASRGQSEFSGAFYSELDLGVICEYIIDPDQELLVIVGDPMAVVP